MPVAFFVLYGVIAFGQTKDAVHTPAKGSPERKALMDALRDEFKKGNGQTVIFQVNFLKVHNGWAWCDATPLDDKNKPVAEGGTNLLHFENDKWVVIDLSNIPEDPKDPMDRQDASPDFVKNLRQKYPDIPTDIFPKGNHK